MKPFVVLCLRPPREAADDPDEMWSDEVSIKIVDDDDGVSNTSCCWTCGLTGTWGATPRFPTPWRSSGGGTSGAGAAGGVPGSGGSAEDDDEDDMV